MTRTSPDADGEHVASCFISYNHGDADLARRIATGLQARNYFVWIDEGQMRVGDSLVTAIAGAIDGVDFLIALVSANSISSAWCQKEIALAMSGEIAAKGITVLPCRVDTAPLPPALSDKLYLAISEDDPDQAVEVLARDMQRHLAPVQPIPGRRRQRPTPAARTSRTGGFDPTVDTRITGVDTNSITMPRNDGTRGSGLYQVPFTLSQTPDEHWAQAFTRHWDRPSRYTTMHRPGIAHVSGNRIVLDGTTMDEVARYHNDTLKLAVAAANADRRALAERQRIARDTAARQQREHEQQVRDIASRLDFD